MTCIRRVLITLIIAAAPAVYAAESYSQCLANCTSSNESCAQCCFKQADVAVAQCSAACDAADRKCRSAAAMKCSAKADPVLEMICREQQAEICEDDFIVCRRPCSRLDPQIRGGCPGEVRAEKCPYDCQTWSPETKSCVGILANGCKPK